MAEYVGTKNDTGDLATQGDLASLIQVSSNPPASPSVGDLWFDSDNGKLFIYYDSFWVNPASIGAGIETAAPGAIQPDDTASEGTSVNLARADHRHSINAAAPSSNLTASTTNAEGSSSSFSRADHSHAITTGTPGAIQPDDSASAGSSADLARADHRHSIAAASAGTITGTNAEGTSTSFARADHNHSYGSKSIPASALALGPTYETSLPSSPVDGQEIYYAADAANGVIWHLRYRSGGGTYKWEFVGGTPLSGEFGGGDANPFPTTYSDFASPANTLSVPLAGRYTVSLTCGMFINSGVSLARLRVSYKIGSTAASDGDAIECDVSRNTLVANDHMEKVKTFTSATTLTLQYKCVESGIALFLLNRRLAITPIAVG